MSLRHLSFAGVKNADMYPPAGIFAGRSVSQTLAILVLAGVTFLIGCSSYPKVPDNLFTNHSGWVSANKSVMYEVEQSDGLVKDYQAAGWRRWRWNEWTAVDHNLDGVADVIYRIILGKYQWENIYEYFEDKDLNGVLDVHYYVSQENLNPKQKDINIPAPRLGENFQGLFK